MTNYTNGFTAPLPTTIVISSVLTSYFFFSLCQKYGMGIGKSYALWAGLGVLSVTIIGFVFFNEGLTLFQISGVFLILGGIAALQLGKPTDSV